VGCNFLDGCTKLRELYISETQENVLPGEIEALRRIKPSLRIIIQEAQQQTVQ
jgi:hypothetical protein